MYFDINDFDEAILGPALLEVSRLLTSIAVGCNTAGYKKSYTKTLLQEILNGYCFILQSGRPITIEYGTATGLVKRLFEKAMTRKEKKLVKDRTTLSSGSLVLLIDNKRLFKTDPAERKSLIKTAQAWLDETRGKKKRKILDLASLVAGTGSIGIKKIPVIGAGYRKG